MSRRERGNLFDGRDHIYRGDRMRIEIYHASKFGNGAKIAEELRRVLVLKGHEVDVHHIDDVKPKEVSPANMYVFGSPTRFGGPIGSMKRFLKKSALPSGSKYAIFATNGNAVPDKKTGQMPSDEEINRMRRTIPIMEEILKEKGMVKIADMTFLVSAEEMKGHLIEGWQEKVVEFAAKIMLLS